MKLKNIKNLSILTGLILTIASCSVQDSSSPSPAIKQANINRAVASLAPRANELLEQTGVPGMAIAVVQGNKVIYAQGFGVRQMGTNLNVDPDTVFQLASVSKSIASTVVAGAVGNGQVSWNDPVSKFLPDFTLANPETGAVVTIAELFAHRSGLPDHAGDLLEDMGYTRAEVIQKLRLNPLKPFLTTYEYTNFGLTAAAQAVANAEQVSWENLSKNILYQPLGMNSTSSSWSDYNNQSNKADTHTKDNQGNWMIGERQPDAQSPAGGVSSSVNDLAKWMIMMLHDGNYFGQQIINKASLLEARLLPESVRALLPPEQQIRYYGLGMNVSLDDTGRQRLSHSGGFLMGAATSYELMPSEQLGIVVLTNGMPMGVPETVAKEFYDIVEFGAVQHDWFTRYSTQFAQMMGEHGELVGVPAPTNPTPALPASDYIGTYDNDYYGSVTITAGAEGLVLMMGPNQQMTYPMIHWDGNMFAFVTTGENRTGLSSIRFTLNQQGQPSAMTIEFFNTEGLGTFEKQVSASRLG